MAEVTTTSDRRAFHVALVGFALQFSSYLALESISIWSQSDAIAAISRFMLIGLPIWLILVLAFKQMRRVRLEALETAELKRARAEGLSDAIFELDDEALLLEQNRMRWMVRWLLPAVTVILAVMLLAGQFIGWNWSMSQVFSGSGDHPFRRTQDPTLHMWFVVGIGFLCFLYARYAIALSRLAQWRLLRAGATCMAGNALACLGLAVALMAATNASWAEPLFGYLIRVGMLVLGLELSANFILDFYRPRTPDVVPRPSFESRLLGLISEPGGIARSIAEAVNYQFGFEVSTTWFYQLLQRWLFPIMVVSLAVVLALTSVVIVDADERAVVERFGRLVHDPVEVLSPGIHLKWPYPIDVVYRAPARKVSEVVIGESGEDEHENDQQAIVWTQEHEFLPEMTLLVASPRETLLSEEEAGPTHSPTNRRRGTISGTKSVAVSLLMVSVPIEYRIKDIKKYLYTYVNPVKLMKGIAYQYLSDYGAGVSIDELMGPGRRAFNHRLKNLIQSELDRLNTGIEVVFAGLRDAHPTAKDKVAAAFQSVVSAQTNMGATINAARGKAQQKLTAVAGTEARARVLDEAIRERDHLREDASIGPAAMQKAQQRVDELILGDPTKGIAPLSGNASALIADARARASRQISDAASKVRIFSAEVAAYTAAPDLYQQRKALEIFEDIGRIRKYLIVGDASRVIVEYNTSEQGSLDRVLSEAKREKP